MFVPRNELKKSWRAVRETFCGAASVGEKRGAWDHGLAARIVALRYSGAHIPITLFAKKAYHFVPIAGLSAAPRGGGHGWSKERCPHIAIDGRALGDRLVEDSTTVRSWVAEAGLLPGGRSHPPSVQIATLGPFLVRRHTDRNANNLRSLCSQIVAPQRRRAVPEIAVWRTLAFPCVGGTECCLHDRPMAG